jgi:Phospholipase_D-nuclease N-terminal
MLIDCLTSTLPSTEKIVWVLVIVFLHFVGALIYFLMGRTRRRVG